jgi:hypothetical protein
MSNYTKLTKCLVGPFLKSNFSYVKHDGFGGLVVRMLASASRVRGIKPGRSR